MTPRQKKIALVAGVALGLVLLPPGAFEVLYRIGLWRLPVLPSLDAPAAPPLVREALLVSLEAHAERPVQPLWLGNYVRTTRPVEDWPVGSAVSLVLAYHLLAKHHVVRSPLEHGLELATVSVWLTRHADAQQLGDLLVAEASFGRGSRDVREAARVFFGKTPESLTLAEAVLLAAQATSPRRLDPACAPKKAEAARDFLLRRMRSCGFISASQLTTALSEPLSTLPRTKPCR